MKSRLEQLFRNLLDNALRHTPPGGEIMVRLSTGSGTTKNEEFRKPANRQQEISVSVHNTGSYVPPEHQQRLFERFYQVDPSRARNGDGSGLGLAIAREIASAHNAEILIDSDPYSGTSFTVVFRDGSSPGLANV